MKNERFNILSLSGGGYRGIYTLNILEELEKQKNSPIGESCDLITGTSVGGIIALAIAAEIPVKNIKKFFEQNKDKIFYKGFRNACKIPILSFILNIFCAKYSQKPLKDELKKFFGEYNINKIPDLKHRVVITSVNYEHRSGKYFKTSHHKRFKDYCNLDIVDIALATSAAPTYFAPHKINYPNGKTELCIDGALSNNAPSFIGYHEAKNILEVDEKNIYLMHIGTANDRIKPYENKKRWGMCSWIQEAIFLTMDSQEKSAEFMTRHILGDNYLHIDSLVKNGLKYNDKHKANFSPVFSDQSFKLDDTSETTINKLEEYSKETIKNINNNNGKWISNFLKHKASEFKPIHGGKNN